MFLQSEQQSILWEWMNDVWIMKTNDKDSYKAIKSNSILNTDQMYG